MPICEENHEKRHVRTLGGERVGTSGQINIFAMEDQVNTIERNQEINHRTNNLGVDNMIANLRVLLLCSRKI